MSMGLSVLAAFAAAFFLVASVAEILARIRARSASAGSRIHLTEEEKRQKRVDWARLLSRKGPEAKRFFLLSAILFFAASYILFAKLVISLALGLIGWFAPRIWAGRVLSRYAGMLTDQLIDGLGLIASSSRAGASLQQALSASARASPYPLAGELGQILRDLQIGSSLEAAVTSFSERINNREVNLLATTLIIARESGGSLGEVLDSIAAMLRERIRLQAKVAALTAQGRMSGIVAGGLPFLLMGALSFLAPEMMRPLFQTTAGNMMLAFVFIWQGIGFLVIRKMVAVEV